MKIKSIEIQGFKSFALPVRLEFDEGMAAIVGPNGSGKSNLVEAVRWVLGEQGISQLRGKRTEDLVWAGSDRRAQGGMAEVSLTLDNADRDLPIPFSEVTITRRAYRSGENEYLLNRSRVRLRDIIELTSAIGQGYTVVGQGTADAALSLTPEGRRGLFEEAADITAHYARRDDSVRRLAQTEANAARVSDVIAELAPRLRTLARQARHAQERATEEARLLNLRMAYYSGALRQSHRAVEEGRMQLGGAQAQAAGLAAEAAAASNSEEELAKREAQQLADIARLLVERDACATEENAAAREVLLLDSRVSQLRSEAARAEAAVAEARGNEMAALAAEKACRSALNVAVGNVRAATDRLRQHDLRADSIRQGQDATRTDLRALRDSDRERREAETKARNHLAVLKERLRAAEEECARQASLHGAQEEDVEAAARQVEERRHAVESARGQRDECVSALAVARGRVRDCDAEITAARTARAEIQSTLREQQARLQLLAEASGVGLGRGVQAVLGAAASGQLEGVLGALGALLEVPQEYEEAIEAALGGAVQNIVVRKWEHAERAISLLKRAGAGRVTFLPLDTLQPRPAPRSPGVGGALGLASDLVECAPDIRPAALHALGRTLVVEDLDVARPLLRSMSALAAIVTLGGETLRPGGSLSGGRSVREGGTLARHRELREFPAAIGTSDAELRETEATLVRLAQDREGLVSRERTVLSRRDAAERALRGAETNLNEARRALDRTTQAREWVGAALERSEAERRRLHASVEEAERETAIAGAEATAVSLALAEAVKQQEVSELEARQLDEQLQPLRTAIAVGSERVEAERRRLQRLTEEVRRHRDAVARQEESARNLGQMLVVAGSETEAAGRAHAQLARRLKELDGVLAPLRVALESARRERERARSEQGRLSAEALKAEEVRLQLESRLQRLEDAHASVLERAQRDLGDGELPPDLQPPPDVQDQIAESVTKLGKLGPVNALAGQEYEELRERTLFLEGQLADLEAAGRDLKQVIDALQEHMEGRFTETFSAVSDRFGVYFQRLFNGGTASLALVTRGDSVGVEIRAQPPGKRPGALTCLSGGERALASCALLFALVKTANAPFCVLDEVDAALDESNVGRFCDLLDELARDTQFVIVTHNRGTIERAGRLYGVSMDAGGISQVLSLKLQGQESQRASA